MNETAPKPSITTTLLRSYFSHVIDLRTYLSEILKPVSGAIHPLEQQNIESASYTLLLHTTYVAFNDPVARVGDLLRPPFEVIAPVTDMREVDISHVLDRVQERIFRFAGSRKPQNIVTAGYRRAFRDGGTGKQGSRVGISNYFVNTIVTALQSPEWETLLHCIGVNPMLYLLSETSIFISLPNGCLCQMTGEPIVALVPKIKNSSISSCPLQKKLAGQKRPCPWVSAQPSKRQKSIGVANTSRGNQLTVTLKRRTPVEIHVARTRLFYTRPQRPPKTNCVVVGLPVKHILNRIYPSYRRPPKVDPDRYVDPDPKEQLQDARHLSKYVFPRQYGLDNPFFVSHLRKYAFNTPDYTDRETEIKSLGSCKTPKRLKEILLLLESMIWRHKKCGYTPLRDKVCPSKLKSTEGTQLDSSVILECVSEQSILLSQMPPNLGNSSIDSNDSPIQPYGLTQAERYAKAKPRFADFACPFVEAEANEVLRQRKLGFSFVRLLPKETGVRPIVNLARRKALQRGGQLFELSINQILQAAFQILTYERYNQPTRLGASVFSPDDIYLKLKEYKSRLPRNPDGTLPQLYFVKVDVQACFDTIEQSKLLDILQELISEDAYMRQKYGQVQMATGYIKRTYVAKAVPEGEHPHFLTTAAKLAGVLRNAIFSDQVGPKPFSTSSLLTCSGKVVYPYAQKREILALLEEHITENIVKIGPDYYRQTVGIPQGSILSALLCCFFYGDMEKRFTNFSHDAGSVLLRLIDDYLFITMSRTKAVQFLAMMNKGHPEYGCFISMEKTLTNFDYETQILNVVEAKQQPLRDTLTVARGRRPGVAFTNKMIKWVGLSLPSAYNFIGDPE
ncbi:hypothetical protein C0995_000085 [Termitomyces sp. Mi166|nr:hypothetical protein C0995_000085 [Termitomyces sp. Mi166\